MAHSFARQAIPGIDYRLVAQGYAQRDGACTKARIKKLSSPDKQLAEQVFPLGEFGLELFQRVLLVKVDLFEFLLHRADIFARGPESALHHQTLAFLGKKEVDKKK